MWRWWWWWWPAAVPLVPPLLPPPLPPPLGEVVGAEGRLMGRGEGAEDVCELEVVTLLARECGRERPSIRPDGSFFCNDPRPGAARECGTARPDHLSRPPRRPAPPPNPQSSNSSAPLLLLTPGREPRGPRRPRKALWQRWREPGPGTPLRDDRDELRELLGDSLGWWGMDAMLGAAAWRTPFLWGGMEVVVVVVVERGREPLVLRRSCCKAGED